MPPDTKDHTVGILYSTDAAFLPITCISIRSMAEHCSGTMPAVTVLLHDVNTTLADRARQFLEAAGVEVRQIHVDPSWCEPWASKRRQSAAKFGLLRMTDWFQGENEVDRLIVVDSDTRFVGDISELADIDLGGCAIAAVDDLAMIADGRLPYFQNKLGIPSDAYYFNSGFMVVDLTRWKQQAIETAAIAVFTEQPEILTFNDQCALNAVLAGQYKRLPFRWNHINGSLPKKWPVSLLHYAGHFKPWNLGKLSTHPEVVNFVGKEHIAYFQSAFESLEQAQIPVKQDKFSDAIWNFYIYAKWRFNGKFDEVMNRQHSDHLKEHIEMFDYLMG